MTQHEALRYQQVAFEKVWHWFVTERHPKSVRKGSGDYEECAYHMPDGRRCAVGVLLEPGWVLGPQAWYGIDSLFFQLDGDALEALQGLSVGWLEALQSVHDGAADEYPGQFTRSIEGRLRRFAREGHLTIPEGVPIPAGLRLPTREPAGVR